MKLIKTYHTVVAPLATFHQSHYGQFAARR